MTKKKKTVAALLAFLFGFVGAHRFYLGQIFRGILYLIPVVGVIAGFIDTIVFIAMSDDEFDRKYNPQLYQRRDSELSYQSNYPNQHRNLNAANKSYVRKKDEHEQVLENVNKIHREIIQLIENSKDYTNDIVSDIKSMMTNYTTQIKQLTERDKNLQKVSHSFNVGELDTTINSLSRKMNETHNPALKEEYQRSISKYLTHKKSYQDLKDQREVIRLRINSSIMSLKQIKIDLIKMANMATYEQRETFFKTFEEKSKDLSNYLNFLEKSYNETNFTV